jgi:hypothetical protein
MIFTSDGLKHIDRPRSRFLEVLVASKQEKSLPFKSSTPIRKKANEYISVKDKANQIKSWSLTSNARQFGTATENKYAGTTSVYARKPSTSIDEKTVNSSSKNNSSKRPQAPIGGETRQIPINASHSPKRPLAPIDVKNIAARKVPSEARRTLLDSGKRSVSSSIPKQTQIDPQSMDSSWFFPVGSKVRHKVLGDGVVLPPNAPESNDQGMSVLVEFRTGEKQKFPVQTTDLSPVIL